ncbi:MAG TPA: hypothetical protein VNN73_12190 [Blastocatellia bacterium]|nr:hypothetical protein [Blastocatellia bacterium]
MNNYKIIKSVKLAAVLLIVAFAFWQKTSSAAQEQQARRLEIVGMDIPVAERAGTDDGAAFVVHFIGDTHGGLEPCG